MRTVSLQVHVAYGEKSAAVKLNLLQQSWPKSGPTDWLATQAAKLHERVKKHNPFECADVRQFLPDLWKGEGGNMADDDEVESPATEALGE